MSIGAVFVSLSITLGGPPRVTLDLSVYPMIETNWWYEQSWSCGLSTPFGFLTCGDDPAVAAEELQHIRQMRALGPAFYPLYVITGGEVFEPYSRRQLDNPALGQYWTPDDPHRFPLIRLDSEKQSLTFMPGYAELLSALGWNLSIGEP